MTNRVNPDCSSCTEGYTKINGGFCKKNGSFSCLTGCSSCLDPYGQYNCIECENYYSLLKINPNVNGVGWCAY